MPVLHINDQQYPLKAGSNRLGAPDVAEIPVAAGLGVQAIVEVEEGKEAVVRRAASDAAIRVNGVALGAEPTPLLHGDRLEIAGIELRYADDRKGGATQFVSADDVETMAAKRAGAVATSGTGGRLVSLVDGKEYTVPLTGLVIGREVGADVVVPLAEVSRRHAEIVPTSDGYRLTDLSTNGVLVNGARVEQSRVLNRSDIIRVGSEEFRFYADVARSGMAPTPAPAAAPLPSQSPPPQPHAAAQAASAPVRIPSPADTAASPVEASRPEVAPLTAEPQGSVTPPRRAAPRPPQPDARASGVMPRWVLLVIVLAIVVVAYFVMG